MADLVKADRLNRLNRVCWDVAEQRAQRLGDRTLQVQPHRCCTAGDNVGLLLSGTSGSGRLCSIVWHSVGGRDMACMALPCCIRTLLDAHGTCQPGAGGS